MTTPTQQQWAEVEQGIYRVLREERTNGSDRPLARSYCVFYVSGVDTYPFKSLRSARHYLQACLSLTQRLNQFALQSGGQPLFQCGVEEVAFVVSRIRQGESAERLLSANNDREYLEIAERLRDDGNAAELIRLVRHYRV